MIVSLLCWKGCYDGLCFVVQGCPHHWYQEKHIPLSSLAVGKHQIANDPLTLFCFTAWLRFGRFHHSSNKMPSVLGPAKWGILWEVQVGDRSTSRSTTKWDLHLQQMQNQKYQITAGRQDDSKPGVVSGSETEYLHTLMAMWKTRGSFLLFKETEDSKGFRATLNEPPIAQHSTPCWVLTQLLGSQKGPLGPDSGKKRCATGH